MAGGLREQLRRDSISYILSPSESMPLPSSVQSVTEHTHSEQHLALPLPLQGHKDSFSMAARLCNVIHSPTPLTGMALGILFPHPKSSTHSNTVYQQNCNWLY